MPKRKCKRSEIIWISILPLFGCRSSAISFSALSCLPFSAPMIFRGLSSPRGIRFCLLTVRCSHNFLSPLSTLSPSQRVFARDALSFVLNFSLRRPRRRRYRHHHHQHLPLLLLLDFFAHYYFKGCERETRNANAQRQQQRFLSPHPPHFVFLSFFRSNINVANEGDDHPFIHYVLSSIGVFFSFMRFDA